MSDPFRLRALKALCTVIEGVTPDNGYVNDLSSYTDEGGNVRPRVFRGRDVFGPNDPLPLVSILEHPRAIDQVNGSRGNAESTGRWELILQGFCPDDGDHPTDAAHILAAEVLQAIAAARRAGSRGNLLGLGTQKPCVTEIEVGAPVVRPADDVISSTAFFYLAVTLSVVEDLSNPFT